MTKKVVNIKTLAGGILGGISVFCVLLLFGPFLPIIFSDLFNTGQLVFRLTFLLVFFMGCLIGALGGGIIEKIWKDNDLSS